MQTTRLVPLDKKTAAGFLRRLRFWLGLRLGRALEDALAAILF
jgi:hypothetical protein